MNFTASQLTRMTASIYRGQQGNSRLLRLMNILRPWYGIFDEPYRWIPHGSRVLDIGCGGGGFLLLAHRLLRLGPSTGYDINEQAIALAKAAGAGTDIHFESRPDVPTTAVAHAEVITLIDVLHHMEGPERTRLLRQLVEGLAPGARLIIKDLDPKPAWRAAANRITDYLSTRSQVSYLSLDELTSYLRRQGLAVLTRKRILKHVWSHYLIVVERPVVS